MTGTSSSRRTQVALAVIALGAFMLRVFPFFGASGAWTYRVDYDEGVYFSAASWLLEGVLPYRDFVFVHPPGILVFLAATSVWTHSLLGVEGAFALSRWIAAGIGAVNVLLVGRLVLKAPGSTLGALLAAAFYATYPELVQVERGPFLEPLLNLVCLSMATAVVTASTSPRSDRWLLIAGALAGFAVSIKVWAVIWVLGAVWGVSSFAGRRGASLFLLAALGACAVVVLPFALHAPSAFITDAGLFHLWRPPDGTVERWPRLEQIVAQRHLASPLLALLMTALLLLRRATWTVTSRIFVTAYVLTLAAFFASAAYWNQYNAHLISSEAVLAGLAVSLSPAGERVGVRAVAFVALLLSLGVSVTHALRRSASDDRHLALARSPLRTVPDCVFTFEPGWSLAAGRLPPRDLIDSYAHQLLGALSGGQRFSSAAEAFAANQAPLPGLEQCRYVVLGERGHRQLSAAALAKLRETHTPKDLFGLEVWER